MGRLSRFEGRVERTLEGAAGSVFRSPLSPVQITKRAEKEMHREKLVSAGRQHAPTLYNVLVSPVDDAKLMGYYPTLAGEVETYLKGKAHESGLHMDGAPLVRFIVDEGLKSGKFDIIAENVSGVIVSQLRQEEMQRYGLAIPQAPGYQDMPHPNQPQGYAQQVPQPQGYAQQVPQSHAQRMGRISDVFDENAYDQQIAGMAAGAAAGAAGMAAGAPYDIAAGSFYAGYDEHGEYTDFDDSSPFLAPLSTPSTAAPAAHDASPIAHNPAPFRVPETITFGNRIASLYNPETGQSFELTGVRMSIGRDVHTDIPLRDENVSRTHAEIVSTGGAWTIRDLGSTNGTSINGRFAQQATLRDGDIISMGKTTLRFIER